MAAAFRDHEPGARADQVIFRKTYAANTTFDSGFIGAVAIPNGRFAYPNLVSSLLGIVYRDPEFIKAMMTP